MPQPVKSTREYLGDSVYADLDEAGMICLTTDNGVGPSNTIYLEKEVLVRLYQYGVKYLGLTDADLIT